MYIILYLVPWRILTYFVSAGVMLDQINMFIKALNFRMKTLLLYKYRLPIA
jgi:hypothetical protein